MDLESTYSSRDTSQIKAGSITVIYDCFESSDILLTRIVVALSSCLKSAIFMLPRSWHLPDGRILVPVRFRAFFVHHEHKFVVAFRAARGNDNIIGLSGYRRPGQ